VIPNTTTTTETGNFGTDTTNVNNTRLLGRVANKGAEGLAITPDGRTLVVALQSALIQDGGTGTNGAFTRIVTIDIPSGNVKAVADVSSNPSFLTNSPAAVALKKVSFLDVVVAKAHGLDPSVDLPASSGELPSARM
jgi:hypothetical protein